MSRFWPYFAFYNTLYFRIDGAWLEELPYMKGVEVAVVLSWGLAVFGIISVGLGSFLHLHRCKNNDNSTIANYQKLYTI